MKNLPRPGIALALLLGLATLAPASRGADLADVDAYWAEVSRTVAEGDFDGYAATYHEDAVLVSQRSGQSVPIAHAHAGWRQGFDDTKAGRARASVEFRFSRRLVGATTAHLTGIFHYRFQADGGQPEEEVDEAGHGHTEDEIGRCLDEEAPADLENLDQDLHVLLTPAHARGQAG